MNYSTDEDLAKAGYEPVGHYAELIKDNSFERQWLWKHPKTDSHILAYDVGNGRVGGITEIIYRQI